MVAIVLLADSASMFIGTVLEPTVPATLMVSKPLTPEPELATGVEPEAAV